MGPRTPPLSHRSQRTRRNTGFPGGRHGRVVLIDHNKGPAVLAAAIIVFRQKRRVVGAQRRLGSQRGVPRIDLAGG
ncbi:UNVERIFIED_CONTAM: hypothetical protein Sangu_0556500 [Sesamum angustifolium]|uniref:Uncharacterized protein n=1 Tax=Sesamum angustifolium TaxID=2727405 RepID=A0AAW2QA01_9LAMI